MICLTNIQSPTSGNDNAKITRLSQSCKFFLMAEWRSLGMIRNQMPRINGMQGLLGLGYRLGSGKGDKVAMLLDILDELGIERMLREGLGIA